METRNEEKEKRDGGRCIMTFAGPVEVSEEVYTEYQRFDERERMQAKRRRRCRIGGVMCKKPCAECPYFLAGGEMTGEVLSLEWLMEESGGEFDVEDPGADVERAAERDELREAFDRVRETLGQRDRVLLGLLLDGCGQAEIAERMSVSVNALHVMRNRLYKKLRAALRDYRDYAVDP